MKQKDNFEKTLWMRQANMTFIHILVKKKKTNKNILQDTISQKHLSAY